MLQKAFSMRLVLRPPSFWIPIWAPMQCDVALFVPYRPVDSTPFGRIFINHKAKVVINSDKTMTLNGLFCGMKEPTPTLILGHEVFLSDRNKSGKEYNSYICKHERK